MPVNFLSPNTLIGSAQDSSARLPLIFLPGWGFDGRVVGLSPSPIDCLVPTDFLDPASLVEDLLAFLDREGLDKIRLAGWSMGAHLALDFARSHPERVDSLFLFSMREKWPESEIAAIRQDLEADSAAFLKSFYRKCFVGDRAGYAGFCEKLQESYLRELDLELLHRGLDYLGAWQADLAVGVADVHLWHGSRDIIAPVDEMANVPGATVEIFEKEGHSLFLSPEFVWPECGLRARKKMIRHRFSRAAKTYDAHADVQKEVAQDLAAQLPPIKPATILEIGCGSGSYTVLLAERFPEADIVALDFAPGMVEVARQRFANAKNISFVCRDGEEFLVSGGHSFDLITSNATLQWFDNPLAALAGMAAGLSHSGQLLCSLFGPETLGELALGLSEVCGQRVYLPPHRFPALSDLQATIGDLLPEATCSEQVVRRRYDSLRELLLHIRKTGTSGWRSASRPLLTRSRMRELDQWFLDEYGGYQVTYQTFVVQGRRRGGAGND